MKADIKAIKEQMTTMMKAMMSMRKLMEVSAGTAIAANRTIERDPIHPPGFNRESRLVLDVIGQRGEATTNAYGPHYV